MKRSSLIRWTARTALPLLSCVFACSGAEDPAGAPPISAPGDMEQTTSVKFEIALDSDGDAPELRRAVNPGPFGGNSVGIGSGFSFSEVDAIKLDVLVDGKVYTKGTGFLQSSPGVWELTLPFLPKGNQLTFVAHAYKGSTEIFTGSVQQAITGNNKTVTIHLAPSNDGAAVDLPGIKKISIPAQFVSNQTDNITFFVTGKAGDDIDYTITSTPSGGTFTPPSGGVKLYNIYGSFVAQYTAPEVMEATDFENSISITNQKGNAVTTTFKTHVVPPGSTQGGKDTGVHVLFNPVINSLSAQRLLDTSDLLWNAAVTDDSDASALSYLWTFAPSGSFSPPPEFTDPTANGTTLENYDETKVTGQLTFAVTDPDGGTTTLHYQIGIGQFPKNPIVPGASTGLNSIRAGGNHTCVLLNNGAVRCWGLGSSGQLGYGNTFTVGDNELPFTAGAVPIGGFGDVGAQITASAAHTCALMSSGAVRCWGKNDVGQLGYGDNTGTLANVGDAEAIDSFGYVNLGSNAAKVVAASGGSHTCALLDTGNVRCWGRNNNGQLGYGHTNTIGDNEQPWQAGDVSVGGPVKDIALGAAHTCALLVNGKVRCWGIGSSGELGNGSGATIGDNELPSAAGYAINGNAVQISAGNSHTCALLDTGFVRCWGYGGYGQLGYGSGANVSVPAVDVNTGGHVLQVAAGGHHTCVLLSTGDIKCWGYNGYGQLGYGGNLGTQTSPPSGVVNLGGSSAFQITTGENHTCALLATGAAWCWGYGGNGQLGYSGTANIGLSNLPSAGGDINILGP